MLDKIFIRRTCLFIISILLSTKLSQSSLSEQRKNNPSYSHQNDRRLEDSEYYVESEENNNYYFQNVDDVQDEENVDDLQNEQNVDDEQYEENEVQYENDEQDVYYSNSNDDESTEYYTQGTGSYIITKYETELEETLRTIYNSAPLDWNLFEWLFIATCFTCIGSFLFCGCFQCAHECSGDETHVDDDYYNDDRVFEQKRNYRKTPYKISDVESIEDTYLSSFDRSAGDSSTYGMSYDSILNRRSFT